MAGMTVRGGMPGWAVPSAARPRVYIVGNGFNPKSASVAPSLYLVASQGVVQSGTVTTWQDQSGNSHDASQATTASRPTFTAQAVGFNNQPVVSFARAAGQFLTTGAYARSQPESFFIVCNDDGSASDQVFFDGLAQNTHLLDNNGGGGDPRMFAGSSLASGVARSSAAKVIIGTFSGTSSALYVSARTVKATGAAGALTASGVTIGRDGASATTLLNGNIAELALFPGALTGLDITNLLNYAAITYGIAIGT